MTDDNEVGPAKFRVGDLVTRDGTDVQRVIEIDDDGECITVKCVKEPLGLLLEDGTRAAPWCRVGETEFNLARRYEFAGDILDGNQADGEDRQQQPEKEGKV